MYILLYHYNLFLFGIFFIGLGNILVYLLGSQFQSYFLPIVGVVFNEMKGVYSQPDNILGRTAQQASSLLIQLLFRRGLYTLELS